MQYWGKSPQSPEEIHRLLYSREAHGVFASDLQRYLSSHGFTTGSFSGEWNDLVENISKGRPLVVAIEVNARGASQHYVVVTGVDEGRQIVLVNDPAQRKLIPMARSDFERRWDAMKRWTLLAVPEGIGESFSETRAVPAPPSSPVVADPVLEQASTAFRSGNLSMAKRLLRKEKGAGGSRTVPNPALRNEFLATLYFLDDNLDAAIKYWNRNGGPLLRDVPMDFETRWDPILLDRTLGIARATPLLESDYRLARKRLDATAAFSRYHFELNPVESSKTDEFDLSLRAADEAPWGPLPPLSWLNGLPYRTISPEFRNIRGRATNVAALLRWDVNKRRGRVAASAPLSAGVRYEAGVDMRREIWVLGEGTVPVRRDDFFFGFRGIPSSRLLWSGDTVVARKSSKTSVRYDGSANYELLHIPERRLTLASELRGQFGRTLATPDRIARAETLLELRWLPQAKGDDYGVLSKVQIGRVWGTPTIDELFSLGIDRDTDLWLRGHSAFRDGRKGAGPTGRRSVLWNSEISKNLFDSALFKTSVAPFVDVARVREVYVDAGIQLRFSLASVLSFSISAGRDLKAGRTVVFTNLTRSRG